MAAILCSRVNVLSALPAIRGMKKGAEARKGEGVKNDGQGDGEFLYSLFDTWLTDGLATHLFEIDLIRKKRSISRRNGIAGFVSTWKFSSMFRPTAVDRALRWYHAASLLRSREYRHLPAFRGASGDAVEDSRRQLGPRMTTPVHARRPVDFVRAQTQCWWL